MARPPRHRLLVLLALVLTGADTGAPQPEPRAFDSPAAALQQLLADPPPPAAAPQGDPQTAPLVVAFGEFHELKGAPAVKSALRRFTEQILPTLGGQMSDLVVETWIAEGNCGEHEDTVVKDVDKTTQRPQTTESEIVTMVKLAKAAGIKPHALDLSCADYKTLLDDKGQVDYDKMLRLLTSQLQKKVRLALARKQKAQGAAQRRLVAVYGGGLHNDLYPRPELREYTFGPPLQAELKERFFEVDLYVPEYIERDTRIPQEPWYPAYRRAALAHPGKTLLVERGPGSFILLFPRSPGTPRHVQPHK